MNMLDGCHHVYLDMGTNTGVQIRCLISWVLIAECALIRDLPDIGYPFLSDDMQWSSYSKKGQKIYLTN